MAPAEREDEALEGDPAPPPDRLEKVAHRGFAVAFDLLQLEPGVTRFQREDIGRLFNPAVLEKELDPLLAQSLDVEGAAPRAQFQALDLLGGTRARAGPARARR